jgi:acyl carrier protein
MNNIKMPKEVIAKALNCEVNSISNDAGMSKHPSWDSLGQLSVIAELEDSYDIKISNDDVLKYSDVKTITELHNSLVTNG